MLTRHPNYYPVFRCLGGACPDTCCRDWDIVLDKETLTDYQHAPVSLAHRLLESLTTDEEGDTCFRLDHQGFCTMLTPDGLCAIQKEWGESHLCGHCAAYPRFIEEFGNLTEASLAMSCPEVARLLLEGTTFQVEEVDDGHPDQPFPDIPPQLLAGLDITRQAVLSGMENQQHPLWERLQGVVDLAYTLQDSIDCGDYSAMLHPRLSLRPHTPSGAEKEFAQALCRFFSSLDPLRPSWPQRLNQCCQRLEILTEADYQALRLRFERHVPQWQRHLTNVAEYLLFRHWHKTVNDDHLYGRATFVSCSTILLYHLFLIQWESAQTLDLPQEIAICAAFSREVEHMEENLELAMDYCGALTPDSIHFPHV